MESLAKPYVLPGRDCRRVDVHQVRVIVVAVVRPGRELSKVNALQGGSCHIVADRYCLGRRSVRVDSEGHRNCRRCARSHGNCPGSAPVDCSYRVCCHHDHSVRRNTLMVADCASYCGVAAHCCCSANDSPRAGVVHRIPTHDRLFRDSGVVVPGVMIALLHNCLRIGHEMTDASHLVVAY